MKHEYILRGRNRSTEAFECRIFALIDQDAIREAQQICHDDDIRHAILTRNTIPVWKQLLIKKQSRTYTKLEQEFMRDYPHQDPEIENKKGRFECKPGVMKLQTHIAVRTASVHKIDPYWEPNHSKDLDHVDGYNWEIFSVSHIGVLDGKIFVWGIYVCGIGAFNQMVPIEHTRNLAPHEREAWSKKILGMYGSHGGGLSYTLSSGVSA